jgi:hypothetical protein
MGGKGVRCEIQTQRDLPRLPRNNAFRKYSLGDGGTFSRRRRRAASGTAVPVIAETRGFFQSSIVSAVAVGATSSRRTLLVTGGTKETFPNVVTGAFRLAYAVFWVSGGARRYVHWSAHDASPLRCVARRRVRAPGKTLLGWGARQRTPVGRVDGDHVQAGGPFEDLFDLGHLPDGLGFKAARYGHGERPRLVPVLGLAVPAVVTPLDCKVITRRGVGVIEQSHDHVLGHMDRPGDAVAPEVRARVHLEPGRRGRKGLVVVPVRRRAVLRLNHGVAQLNVLSDVERVREGHMQARVIVFILCPRVVVVVRRMAVLLRDLAPAVWARERGRAEGHLLPRRSRRVVILVLVACDALRVVVPRAPRRGGGARLHDSELSRRRSRWVEERGRAGERRSGRENENRLHFRSNGKNYFSFYCTRAGTVQ